MGNNSVDIKTAFELIVSKDRVQGNLLRVCELIYYKGFDARKSDVLDLLKELKFSSTKDFKDESLKILILYIRLALNDNILSVQEKNNIKFLKLLLEIKDGDFKNNKAIFEQVKNIVKVQLELIYMDDENIDNSEALHKVDLQEVFGLSYDDFLTLTNHFDMLIIGSSLDSQESYHNAIRRTDSFVNEKALEKWYKENLLNDVEEVKTRSRKISQSVKDKVWNRDNGRCVLCGSNENIEFDHIVPFSKGGSNTYRNIQILCESCNRKKSDSIGINEDYFDSNYDLESDEWLDSI